MSKRQVEVDEQDLRKNTIKRNVGDSPASKMEIVEDNEMGDIDDMSGDESDEIHEIDGSDIDDDDNDDSDMVEDGGQSKALKRIEEDGVEELADDSKIKVQRVYIPQREGKLQPGEVMEPDMSTYKMLHSFGVDYPSLSFDIIPDHLGSERTTYPQTSYLISGTQAEKSRDNSITVFKLDQMHKTYAKDEDDEEDDDEEDDEGEDTNARMDYLKLPTPHTTNRIRMSPHCQTTGEFFAASMSESGEAFIWDVTQHYKWFDNPGSKIEKSKNRPVHTIRNHGNVEGYGIDWSPLIKTGALLTGDMDGRIYLTRRTKSGWSTDKTPFQVADPSPNRSIEDIQWSPSEENVFASCGSDGYIRVWDIRAKNKQPRISIKASDSDVNVISWNKIQHHLLASGHDDGTWAVWDLRKFGNDADASTAAKFASFDFHKDPITSIEFSPLDEAMVAVGSEDNTVTLWDLSLEDDSEEQKKREEAGLSDIPGQMLFMHWQKDVKEVHFNRQFPGGVVTTGSEGFSCFKTISF